MARRNEREVRRPGDWFPPATPGTKTALDDKADKVTEIATDTTLTGGGDLSADRELGIDITAEEARIVALIQSKIIGALGCTVTIVGDTIEISVP